MELRINGLTAVMLLGLVASTSTQNHRTELPRHSEVLPSELRAAALGYFRDQFSPTWGAIQVKPVPGLDTRLLLAGPVHEPQGFDALRLFLLERLDSGFVILSRTGHMADGEWLTPEVFSDSQMVLVLADVGSEYSWGLRAFVVEGDSIRTLPAPKVAAPDYESMLGHSKSALPYVTVFHTSDGIELEFDIDLMLAPGSREERLVCRVQSRVSLLLRDGKWFVRGGEEIPTSPMRDLPRCKEPVAEQPNWRLELSGGDDSFGLIVWWEQQND